jgi:hypothetical protein
MMTARLLLMPVSEVGGTERRALGKSGDGVEGEQGGDGEERAQPGTEFFGASIFFMSLFVFFLFWSAVHPPSYANISINASRSELANFAHKMKCRPW